ncbi:hypothetical protein ACVOMT_18190 [Sphingomonas panni]
MQLDIGLLEQQHAAIVAAVGELRALTDLPLDQGLPHIAKARITLAKVIADNVATEIAAIHAPLKAHGMACRIPDYADIETWSCALRMSFSAHIAEWSTATIRQDWSGYARSLRAITATLLDLLDREERSLFPAARTLLAGVRPIR